MKQTTKIVTAFLVLLFCGQVNAQYFQSLYVDQSIIGNGLATKHLSQGHIMAGITKPQNLTVARTDPDGSFANTDNFINSYVLVDPATNTKLQIDAVRIEEFSSGKGYAAIGSYFYYSGNTPIYGIFYMRLEKDGNVNSLRAYQYSAHKDYPITLTATTESVSTWEEMFAIAVVKNPNDTKDAIALRFDPVGNLIWGYVYDFSYFSPDQDFWISDVLESPYDKELEIVGRGKQNGLWLALAPSNGAFVSLKLYDNAGDERFSSIAISEDPNNYGKGFILGGTVNNPGYKYIRAWAVKTDPGHNIQWTNIYWAKVEAKTQEGVDIVGRKNTYGKYEYYLASAASNTSPLLKGIVVFKIYDDGKLYPTPGDGVFKYFGSSDTLVVPTSVDVNDDPSSLGLSVYSTAGDTYGNFKDMLVTKAYFNGVTACSYALPQGIVAEYPVKILDGQTKIVQKIYPVEIKLVEIIKEKYNTICYDESVKTGSNAKLIKDSRTSTTASVTSTVYPNPLAAGEENLKIGIASEEETTVDIMITSVTGAVIYAAPATLHAGNNEVVIPASKLAVAAGIYDVAVKGSSIQMHQRLVVQ